MSKRIAIVKEDANLSPAQLDDKYNEDGDGQHPVYPREMWRIAVANEGTISGYWEWVAYMVKSLLEFHYALIGSEQ